MRPAHIYYWNRYEKGHLLVGLSIYLCPSDYTVQTLELKAQVLKFGQETLCQNKIKINIRGMA